MHHDLNVHARKSSATAGIPDVRLPTTKLKVFPFHALDWQFAKHHSPKVIIVLRCMDVNSMMLVARLSEYQ